LTNSIFDYKFAITNDNLMQPIAKHAFVQMDNPMQREYICASGIKIHLPDHVLNAEEWCTTECIFFSGDFTDVEGVPLQRGDIVAVDYRLLSDYEQDSHGLRTYNRVLAVEDQVVWYADEYMLMGVWREGRWVGIGKWVWMTEVDAPDPVSDVIHIPDSFKSQKEKGQGEIVSGNNLPIGETAIFDEKFRSVYDIRGIKYIILDEDRILALKIPDYGSDKA